MLLLLEGNETFDEVGKLLPVILSVNQEIVLQELLRGWSMRRLLGEAGRHKVLEVLGPLFLDRRRTVLDDVKDDTSLLFVDIWRVTVGHFHCEDAETPDIDLGVVATLTLDKLGGHPAHSANFAHSACLLLGQLHGVPEVSQLDLTLGVDQDVVTLDISVDNVLRVQVEKTLEGLLEHVFANFLVIAIVQGFDERGQCVVHDLHKDPESFLELESFNALQNSAVVSAHSHQTHLVVDDGALVLVLRLDELERADEVVSLALHLEHSGETTGAKLACDVVELGRVFGAEGRDVFKLLLEVFLGGQLQFLDDVHVSVTLCFVHGHDRHDNFEGVGDFLLIDVVVQVGVELLGQVFEFSLALFVGFDLDFDPGFGRFVGDHHAVLGGLILINFEGVDSAVVD